MLECCLELDRKKCVGGWIVLALNTDLNIKWDIPPIICKVA